MAKDVNRKYIANMEREGYILYYAYGEEIDIETMTNICPKAVAVGQRILKGYRFSIDKKGFPNALTSKISCLEGILWLIKEEELENLKKFKLGFKEEIVKIEVEENCYQARLLVSLNPGKPEVKKQELFKKMLQSAKFWNFSEVYCSFLLSMVIATSK